MIPGCSVSGDIRFNNIDVFDPKLDIQHLRREIGMIFQKPVPFPLSIRRNIELPLREHGMQKKADLDERVEQVLQDVGLWQEVKDRLNKGGILSFSLPSQPNYLSIEHRMFFNSIKRTLKNGLIIKAPVLRIPTGKKKRLSSQKNNLFITRHS